MFNNIINISINNKIFTYISYYTLLIISQIFLVLTAFITLPYPNLSLWESYKMCIPYAWLDWVFLTYAVNISHVNKDLLTPNQILFSIIGIQVILISLFNYFYLNKKITTSDYVSYIVIFIAYFVSIQQPLTKFLDNNNNNNNKSNSLAIAENLDKL